jgi:ribosome biogenesis GTPase A
MTFLFQVRDARIPIATNHPQVPQWIGNKPSMLVMNRIDQITPVSVTHFVTHFESY